MIKAINKDQMLLAQKAQPATKQDAQVGQDLLDTLAANADRCVGMAANMIGVPKHIIVVAMGLFNVLMYNAKIVNRKAPYTAQEGCLSLTGERPAQRWRQISMTYQDTDFKPQRANFSDFTAQIIQHELDHCAGIII